MGFESYLEVNAQKIDEKLEEILSEFLSEVKKTNIKLLPFALGLINSCKGGKRIRGVLVKLGYEIAGSHLGGVMASASLQPATIRGEKSQSSEILKISAAYEILHTALLIHDDIMDQSPLRRGRPSLYKALGTAQAISVGDIGLYLPIKIISASNFTSEIKIKALNFLAQTVINTGWGQCLDVAQAELTSKESGPTFEVSQFINLYKTAKYTIAGPLILGAILAGMGPTSPRLRGIKEFGENLGIAFQIQDDILDKEVVSVDVARTKALEYVSRAKGIIPKITSDKRMVRLLQEMADYLV